MRESGNNNNNNNNNKTKDDNKSKAALNGDATEDEKVSIKTEVDDEKPDIKEEPGTNGNGNPQSVSWNLFLGDKRIFNEQKYGFLWCVVAACESRNYWALECMWSAEWTTVHPDS